jgi:pantoate--beta-alanine ligase
VKKFQNIQDLRSWRAEIDNAGETVAFVPTMGSLHEGHLALMRKAKEIAHHVVVSIYVNPLQFDNPDDLVKYPRNEKDDLIKCRQENVAVVFLPTDAILYPSGFQTSINVSEVSKWLCGAYRPGHLEGVATVLAKLFNLVRPNSAVFGEKDFQQLVVIRRMVKDLNMEIEIVGHPIVREADGLAMSSRNQRLSKEEREAALVVYRSIQAVEEAFEKGEHDAANLLVMIGEIFAKRTSTVSLEYAEICSAKTLEAVDYIQGPALYAVAAYVGGVRLIDNVVLDISH